MSASTSSPMMTVKLREATVGLLMAQRIAECETLDVVVARLAGAAASTFEPSPERHAVAPEQCSTGDDKKYALIMLGDTLRADTLFELFAKVVDALAAVDPAAVERLAMKRSRKRAFVAKDRESIHPGRPELQVRRTASGWWVSANIGTADLERALQAACETSGLSYGQDIRLSDRRR